MLHPTINSESPNVVFENAFQNQTTPFILPYYSRKTAYIGDLQVVH